jgi:hypothetical protein
MTALQIDTGVTGAKRQSWRRANPRYVLKRLLDDNPELSEEEIEDKCWTIIHRDQDQMRTVFEHWFGNTWRSLIRPEQDIAATREQAAAVTGNLATAIGEKIDQKIKVVLLDMILPTGKLLRHSTREELLGMGGWAQRLAERLQPQQTVEQAGLSEARIRRLYRG